MSDGRRVRGGTSGAAAGLGIAVLLQQFAVLPLTTLVLVGLIGGMALIGVALGWPRDRTGSPTPPEPQESPTAPPS